jgi:predicted GNAT family N-acyltransferase
VDAREIPIRWALDPDDVRGALAVRERVFCEEQGVPRAEEIDERDEQARTHGCSRVRLASQLEARSVYERAGFAVESDPFEEAGIEHVWMGLRLAPGAG